MPEHLVRFLRSLYAAPADGVSDAELLRRCAAGKDDAAFELLVRRHAGLVWRVCRSDARDHHAAEDAFQAAFLALARRPAAVRDPSAAGWLSKVAYHAALKARGRPGDTSLSVEPASRAADPADLAGRAEVAPLLHAELNRLPEKYRLPVVLCHLHGLTQQEAASQLGLPLGTVATRVRRGLDRLRNRLTRRGVAVPAVGGLFAAPASAVTPALTDAAVRLTASAVPAHVTRLAEGALAAMNPVRWKLPAAALVAAAALGTAWAVGPPVPDNQPTPPAKTAAEPPKKAVPSTYTQREQSRKALQRVAFAVHDYLDAHGHLPADVLGKDGKPLLSWRVAILPQLDNEFLYSQFRLDEPWDGEHNRKLLPHMPRAFRSPVQGDGPATETYFQGFAGPGAGFEAGKKLTITDFTDGTSNTIMLAEAGPPVPWTKPADRPYGPERPLPAMDGPYSDRFIAVFWDGSPRDLRWNLDARLYRLLIERADATVIPGEALDFSALPPQTDEDRKLIERSRNWVAGRVRYIGQSEAERLKLLDELKATGGVPEPAELGPDASVEDWKELEKRLERRERLLWDEVKWLRRELERRKKGRK